MIMNEGKKVTMSKKQQPTNKTPTTTKKPTTTTTDRQTDRKKERKKELQQININKIIFLRKNGLSSKMTCGLT